LSCLLFLSDSFEGDIHIVSRSKDPKFFKFSTNFNLILQIIKKVNDKLLNENSHSCRHTRKTITDFVSMRDNSLYIMNLCHMVSILSDSLIYCCGGLLPLMASGTSTNFENDVLEACGGMELEAAFSFMNRVLNVVDVIAFASSINFASVETHRNMSAGGVLRQCIRLGKN